MAKAENKVRKPVFKKNIKLPKLKDAKENVSITTSKAIGREIAQTISRGWKQRKTKVMYLYTLFMYYNWIMTSVKNFQITIKRICGNLDLAKLV